MKYIYSFNEGDRSMKDLLGGKGANLAEMSSLGLPVPFGFTISTELCGYFLDQKDYPRGFYEELNEKMAELEHKMQKRFGDSKDPLLVSVRSGSRVSMPGMMDTVLNLGLNDDTVEGLARKTGNERFAYDAYRRFVAMFGNVVLGLKHHLFEHEIQALKDAKGVEDDTELGAEDLKRLVAKFKEIVQNETGEAFPEDPAQQLKRAIDAVFLSWNNKRAITYRNMHGYPHNMGTAVNVQAMVFGNRGEGSGTGVAFTRNPSTGEKEFFGEFLTNAQGEDVVAGIRTPQPILELQNVMPDMYEQLLEVQAKLEEHYKDMQDIEFTIEEGQLYLLQTRTGKRSARAAVKLAVDMCDEGLITKEEAILRVDPKQIHLLLHPSLDPKFDKDVIAKGLPASPGAAVGRLVFTADDAVHQNEEGEAVLLVRQETSPEDIHGMHSAQGILTSTGGMTSHAAVVARGMGKPCVAGCKALQISEVDKTLTVDGHVYHEGDVLTIDGSSGEVIAGRVPTIEPELSGDFEILMEWADEIRKLNVYANADNPHDAEVARRFGAEGIGLCRTEHMFFEEDRILHVRKMMLAQSDEARQTALDQLRPVQREDFKALFRVMNGLPVVIRLLDPPLHEFLPQSREKLAELAKEMDTDVDSLDKLVHSLHEFNPMLGHRGCRLGVTTPMIYEMQSRAIFEAASAAHAEGIRVNAKIEVPLISHVNELRMIRERIETIAEEMGPFAFEWSIGTMIEIPRACITADEVAQAADFFAFGTNDLTQLTFGMSRDDSGSFLPEYIERGVIEDDPTATIDQDGVGQLMRMAVKLGRMTKKDLEVGICGEHGGEPRSVAFCHEIGLDYVSCSPYRVPVARLAAAQAVLEEGR